MIIKEFYNKDFYDNNRMCITAEVTDSCNYNCKYCYNKKPRTNQFLDLKKLLAFVLDQKKQTNKNIEVSLIGGEPMLVNDIIPFSKELLDNDIWITCFSNFSVNIEKYKELLAYNKKFEYILTWHSENKDFLNKLLLLKEYYGQIAISIMYEHLKLNESIDIFNSLKNEIQLKNVILSKITNVSGYDKKYTSEMLMLFEQLNNIRTINSGEFIINTKNKTLVKNNPQIEKDNNPFVGWKCEAGKELMYITVNGNVYPCATMINSNNVIGNINYSTRLKNKKILICSSLQCCHYEVKKTNIFNKNLNII